MKIRTLKVNNSFLELEEDCRELRDRESKDAEIKIRKEIDKPFFKSITVYRWYG